MTVRFAEPPAWKATRPSSVIFWLPSGVVIHTCADGSEPPASAVAGPTPVSSPAPSTAAPANNIHLRIAHLRAPVAPDTPLTSACPFVKGSR